MGKKPPPFSLKFCDPNVMVLKFSHSQMNGSPYVDMMYALCELDNVKLLVSLANSLEYNKAHE